VSRLPRRRANLVVERRDLADMDVDMSCDDSVTVESCRALRHAADAAERCGQLSG
jgi:hypothetical protein